MRHAFRFLASWNVELLSLAAIGVFLGFGVAATHAQDGTLPNMWCGGTTCTAYSNCVSVTTCTGSSYSCGNSLQGANIPTCWGSSGSCIVPPQQVTCTNLCNCTCYNNVINWQCKSTTSCSASSKNQACNE